MRLCLLLLCSSEGGTECLRPLGVWREGDWASSSALGAFAQGLVFLQAKTAMVNFQIQLPFLVCEVFFSFIVFYPASRVCTEMSAFLQMLCLRAKLGDGPRLWISPVDVKFHF